MKHSNLLQVVFLLFPPVGGEGWEKPTQPEKKNHGQTDQTDQGYAGWHTSVNPYGQKALTRYEAVAAYKYSEGHGKTQRYTWHGYGKIGIMGGYDDLVEDGTLKKSRIPYKCQKLIANYHAAAISTKFLRLWSMLCFPFGKLMDDEFQNSPSQGCGPDSKLTYFMSIVLAWRQHDIQLILAKKVKMESEFRASC